MLFGYRQALKSAMCSNQHGILQVGPPSSGAQSQEEMHNQQQQVKQLKQRYRNMTAKENLIKAESNER